MGNTRYVLNPTARNSLTSLYDYYPFGKVLRSYEVQPSRFLSTEHELDRETGYTDRHARWYDEDALRFIQVDPLAEKYPAWSPYNFCMNNPLVFIDPDGMDPTPFYTKLLGHTAYYVWRARDFMRQNKGMAVPEYYMEYGHKYINRFTNETNKTMSGAGRTWLKEVRKNLQVVMENRLAQPDGADLERDNDKFRSFAFDSHVDAYWNENGKVPLYSLGAVDLTKILLTPDVKDLTSLDGLRQVKDIMGKFITEKPEELKRIIGDAYNNMDTIMNLMECKAKKEGVLVDEIRKVLSPLLILIPSNEKTKTD